MDAEGGPSVLVYIGTYTGSGSEGVYVYRMDTATGALEPTGRTGKVTSPSFVALRPGGRNLYAANEVGQFAGKPGGGVSAFAVDPATGGLSLLNQESSHGGAPCYITVDATGRCALVANYSGGSVVVLPIGDEGQLGAARDVVQHHGSGPNPRRQEAPHVHSVTMDPSNRFALVCDLGLDKVFLYELDRAAGRLTPGPQPWAELHPGAGPRHVAFHPNGAFVYVINEIDSTMSAFSWEAARGKMTHLHTLSTLPEGFNAPTTCADVHVHPSGKFLYGSNRGHDSIVLFALDPASGKMSLVGWEPTQGKNPRNFAIDPSGRFLVAANQDGDNLVVFRIDPDSGKLSPTGHAAAVSKPVCVKFAGR